MNVNFTITSIIRPDISLIALTSLNENLLGINLYEQTAYVNIDPIDKQSVKPTMDIISRFFKKVIFNTPKIANFASAVKWCWSNAQSDIIFHFEDDWIFTQKIHINDLLYSFDKNTKQVILRAYMYEYKNMVLSPSLITKDCYSKFSIGMNDYHNPEIQLKNKTIYSIQPNMVKCYGKNEIVKDIGREWIKHQPFNKGAIKRDFVKYETN